MSDHTPGPWQATGGPTVIVKSSMGNICRMFLPDRYMEGTEAANARLIAAAPELLRACIRAAGQLETRGGHNVPNTDGAYRTLMDALAELDMV